MPIMRAGRRRWAIENETIKTLKDRRGYNFEHNYGHGSNHLADVFPTFGTLALLIDQVQHFCCRLFQQARDYQKRNLYLWDSIRCFIRIYNFPDWRTFYLALSGKLTNGELAELLICSASPLMGTATSKAQRHRSATLKLEATSHSAKHLSQHKKN